VLIGVRAGKFVAKELKLAISNKFLWTNSECVLHWMKTTKLLPLFINNQIKEIHSHDDMTFCYVPSKQNLADFPTKGLTVSKITCGQVG